MPGIHVLALLQNIHSFSNTTMLFSRMTKWGWIISIKEKLLISQNWEWNLWFLILNMEDGCISHWKHRCQIFSSWPATKDYWTVSFHLAILNFCCFSVLQIEWLDVIHIGFFQTNSAMKAIHLLTTEWMSENSHVHMPCIWVCCVGVLLPIDCRGLYRCL